MKILHIIPSYLPAYRQGGPTLSVHSINKQLVKNGFSVTVYTTNIDSNELLHVPLGQEVDIDGVKVFYFGVSFRPWQYSLEMHKTLSRNLKSFDLVHITSVFLAASTLGACYAKKFKTPYIISPRGSLMKGPLSKKSFLLKKLYISTIEKRNLSSASAVHFTSQMEKEEYISEGLPLKKGVVIPNCFDFLEFENLPKYQNSFRKKFAIGSEKKLTLFLGRISWKKGFDTLIPAFAEVLKEEKDAILVIAGPDDEGYKREVEKLIYSFKLSGVVVFTGMLTGQDKISAIYESDVFVLPSYSENFGNSPVESMAGGLPIVITKYVGISPEVEKYDSGLVVDKTVNDVAVGILKILQDENLARKISENGKRLVGDEFSCDKVVNRYMKEYENLT